MTTISGVGIGSASQTTVGTLTVGVWNATAITGQYGGTGVNNSGKTITIGGNVTFSGAFTFAATISGNTAVTFPTSGTLATTGQLPATVDQTAASVTMVANTTYIADKNSTITFTVPATAAIGDTFEIEGLNTGLSVIQMNAGQICNFGSSPTSTAGTMTATNQYDVVKFKCIAANTTFSVVSAVGNWTIA